MKQIGEVLKEHNLHLATENPVLRGGFTQVPNFILKDPNLSVGAKVAYAMFLSYAWHNDSCFPGQDRLAEENQNDDIENGLALCKNAHWMFDEGLWSVRDDGRVLLSPHRFTENGPEGLRLQPYAGRLLQFAAGVSLRPKTDYFARHRKFHGMRA